MMQFTYFCHSGNLKGLLEVSYYMERLFYITVAFALLTLVAASCKEKSGEKQLVERLEDKYKEISREAEYVTVNGAPVAQKTRFIQPEDKVVADYSNLKQIALIRHGEPDLEKTGKFTYDDAKSYIKNYDSVGIILPDNPFFMLEDDEEVILYTSTIPRAQATAKYLFGEHREAIISADFREFERKIGNRSVNMRLPLKYWTTAARLKWMLGIDRDGLETFSEARERARKAAEVLAETTEENPKVVLVAHGFLNRYIKKNLEKMGWHVVRDGGDNYFATTILVKIEEDEQDDQLVTDANR